jgi:hypothetical protein
MVLQAVLALEQADQRLDAVAAGPQEGALGGVLAGRAAARGRGDDRRAPYAST